MDLNELFFRHQIALMRVDGAADCGERRRQGTQADSIALRIGEALRGWGALAMPPANVARSEGCTS
jgi:hypothetical protein